MDADPIDKVQEEPGLQPAVNSDVVNPITPAGGSLPVDPHSQGFPLIGKPFGIRVAAYLIDYVLYFVAFLATSVVAGFIIGTIAALAGFGLTRKTGEPLSAYNFILSLMLGLIYFVLFEWFYSASPGKLILKLRVVREDGTPPGLWASLVRGLFRYIDGLIFGIPAYFSMNKSGLRQRLGDRAAHTVVVSAEDARGLGKQKPWWGFVLASLLTLGLFFIASVGIVYSQFEAASSRTSVPASEINLQARDLSAAFTLVRESGKETFSESSLLDANLRNYVASKYTLTSLVLVFPFKPVDTNAMLLDTVKKELDKEAGNAELAYEPLKALAVGDRGALVRLTRPSTGEEGYILFLVRNNVIIRIMGYGYPGSLGETELVRLANLMDDRIR
jgi:uncharacterized RDD family membrane protein YckC